MRKLFSRPFGALWELTLWLVQLGTAAWSFWFALGMLLGTHLMIDMFNGLALPQWCRYVTGVLGLAGGIILLFPASCAVGAVLLMFVWVGLLIADLLVTGQWLVEAMLIAGTFIIAWGRRERLPGSGDVRPEIMNGVGWWRVFQYAIPVALTIAMMGGVLYYIKTDEWSHYDLEGGRAYLRNDYSASIADYAQAIEVVHGFPFLANRVVRSLNNMGIVYVNANRVEEAEATFRRAIGESQRSLPHHDPLYYRSTLGLAAVFEKQMRYPEAEALYLQAVATYAAWSPPPSEALLARACKAAARLAAWIDAPTVAAQLEQNAKYIVDHALGEELAGLPNVLDVLGQFYAGRGERKKAEQYYRRALLLKGQILGGPIPDLGQRLLDIHLMTGAKRKAIDASELYATLRPVLDPMSPYNRLSLAFSLNEIAEIYREQGRYIEAEPFYHLSLAIERNSEASQTRSYATTLTNLGLLYNSQGRYAEAEARLLEALAIREKILSSDHPELAHSYNNLGLLYDNQGNYAKAEPLYMKAFAIRERSLDPRHPKTVLTLRLLADLYFRQSQFAKAEPLYRLLLDIKENELGKAHPDLVTLNWTLAGIYCEQKKYPEALSLYETLIAQFEEQVGPESSQLIPVLTSYAYVLQLSGKGSAAKRVKKRIRELSPELDPLPPATPKRPRPQKSTPLTAPA